MRTAIWLYLFMFVAIFDLHAQYPVLSPFALSLGAAPSFIGLIMGLYSATHIPGNILAGYGVDRFGSRIFISLSLIGAGILLLLQARVTEPWQLLVIRSISGFVLAFLSPACLALLAKLAKNHIQQGKLMSGNGLVHTLASVVSPALGAMLVAEIGFSSAFMILGWLLLVTGILSWFGINEKHVANGPQPDMPVSSGAGSSQGKPPAPSAGAVQGAHTPAAHSSAAHTPAAPSLPAHAPAATAAPVADSPPVTPWVFFLLPLAVSCSQGILYFELPLSAISRASIVNSGFLFSVISIGALFTLSMMFLNHYSPLYRTAAGSMVLAAAFFAMAVDWPFPISATLFVIGMCKGVIYPAMSTLLAYISPRSRYGRAFAILSISLSLGSFIGPVVAGYTRDQVSPYFFAFLALMLALTILPFIRIKPVEWNGGTWNHSTFPGK